MQSEDGEADNESNLVAMVTTLGIDSSFLSGGSSSSSKDHNGKKNNMKLWNDDYTIKHKLNDLLPPFDPRPGRVNLPQTLDLEIPPPGNNHYIFTLNEALG